MTAIQSTTNLSQPRVLVADDQADVLASLKLLLKNEGFAPEFAESPQEVVRAVAARPYDLLLLDMNYARDTTSGTEGLELLAELQALDSTLPVVLMTAWGSVKLAVEAMRGGGRDFVEKPWDNDELLNTIRRNLGAEGLSQDIHSSPEGQAEGRELQEACTVQRRLLPQEAPVLNGYQIHSSWQPAGEVGGDYFDFIRLSDSKVAICIADVSGKGLPAALLMASLGAAVRAYAPVIDNPSEICSCLNKAALDSTPAEKFVTFF